MKRAVLILSLIGLSSGLSIPTWAGEDYSPLVERLRRICLAFPEAGERISGLQAPRPAESDAIAALVKLGYSQIAAGEAVARAGQNLGDSAALDVLIRESLRQLARAI